MKDIEESVKLLINDLATNEVAVLEKIDSEHARLISFSKVELAGDAFQVFNTESAHINNLHHTLLCSSANNREAVWNFIIKALS